MSLACSVLAVAVSAYHIYMHLHNFNNPFFQSKIISIQL
ncbi:MAG: OSTA/TMEM184 family protein [Bdellovibrionales bacterium]|nr:OSTA/TMEM184 family protein [Bdellovibrionales bacterium]